MNHANKYHYYLRKEAEFWGKMAELRAKQGIPDTMDYRLACKGRIKRGELGWGDLIQDRELELKTPFGKAKSSFIDKLKEFEGKNVLDLGCGAGWLALELARCGANVCAIDCSLQGMLIARQYQRSLSEKSWQKIGWIVGDMNNLPISNNNRFDLITSWDALHHVKEIDYLINKLSSALKPGGMLMICERVQGGEENIPQKIGAVVKSTVNLLFPMVIDYSSRANNFKNILLLIKNKLCKKNSKSTAISTGISDNDGFVSPFEDICGKEMIRHIDRYFSIEKYVSYRAFSDDIERSLYLGEKLDLLRKIMIISISWLDYFFIKTKALPGQIILLYCKKR